MIALLENRDSPGFGWSGNLLMEDNDGIDFCVKKAKLVERNIQGNRISALDA
jgi:hypothetical protein